MNNIYIKLFILCCLFFINNELSAQKNLKDSVLTLNFRVDSLKRSLAEARREWQKCKENSSASESNLSTELSALKLQSSEIQRQLSENQNSSKLLSDSLKQTVETAAVLQKVLAAKEMQEAVIDNNAKVLSKKLNDSLTGFLGPNCYIYEDKADVFIIISDSLLMQSAYYLSANGRKFLEKLTEILKPHFDRSLRICAYADEGTKTQDLWRMSGQKAMLIAAVLENSKFPEEKLTIEACGRWKGIKNYKKPPFVFELKLE
jgi:hypothetical protein